MKEYVREYPRFSLCGLNCGLCPRYHAEGPSRCPGCGGPDFHLKHPSCAVITCNKNHDQVEYCYQCSSYPCQRYIGGSDTDSFISYRNVASDFEKAATEGIDQYKKELEQKIEILNLFLSNYNDGRKKSFYCNAINQLEIADLKEIMDRLSKDSAGGAVHRDASLKEKAESAVSLIENKAAEQNVDLKLRKSK